MKTSPGKDPQILALPQKGWMLRAFMTLAGSAALRAYVLPLRYGSGGSW